MNIRQFNQKMDQRIKNVEKEVEKRMVRSVELVRGHAVKNIARGSKSGTTRQLYNPRRTHTSSAPGEFPASDTGFLVSSITTDVDVEGTTVVGKIVASAPYAPHLEFGTTNMQARPFMQPSLESQSRRIEKIFAEGKLVK